MNIRGWMDRLECLHDELYLHGQRLVLLLVHSVLEGVVDKERTAQLLFYFLLYFLLR